MQNVWTLVLRDGAAPLPNNNVANLCIDFLPSEVQSV